jgi:hypothetical protein
MWASSTQSWCFDIDGTYTHGCSFSNVNEDMKGQTRMDVISWLVIREAVILIQLMLSPFHHTTRSESGRPSSFVLFGYRPNVVISLKSFSFNFKRTKRFFGSHPF